MNLQILNNRYRVIKELGAGGFGTTYLAEDTQMPSGKKCVIKELKPIHNNTQIYQLVQQRFQREAAILESLGDGCSQIPKLYAYFEENRQFYLIQQWIEGQTLAQIVSQQGILSETAVRNILLNLLPVLDYVHSHGIVHRDIKPDNIMIRLQDNLPVLIDFGAVRETMSTSLNSQGVATTSIVIGTPGYMPGEQGAGKAIFSSDLYSLGLTAIYALTGKHPQQLEVDHSTGEFVWRQDTPHLSPSLVEVLEKSARCYPRDRFANAKSMLEALRNPSGQYSQIQPQPAVPYSPTVPIPPVPSYTPPAPSYGHFNPQPAPNRGNAAIIGGSIAGGLIIAGTILAIALRPPATNNSPSPSVAVNSPSPIVEPINSQVSVSPAIVTAPASVPVRPPLPPVLNTPAPPAVNTPIVNNLASDAGVDYRNLENLLAAGRWKSADRETANLMVAIAKPPKSTYLDAYSARRISCTDLQTIDRLWRNYSNNRFGFSIQKDIWNRLGGNKAEFDRYIGWRVGNRKVTYENISFNSQAPTAHLPYIKVLKHEEFFSSNNCF